MVIGITGGIGSGKSVVSRILRLKGFPVYDCDYEARNIMDSSQTIKSQIKESLGHGCVDEQGNLVREEIAGIVFTDESKLNWLNSLVHSHVRDHVKCKLKSLDIIRPFFIESAILVTSGLSSICDRIWLVEAPMDVRLKRVSLRDNLPQKKILQRIQAQSKEYASFMDSEKIDKIINNNDESLLLQINELLTQI